jgi:hypothetical protein
MRRVPTLLVAWHGMAWHGRCSSADKDSASTACESIVILIIVLDNCNVIVFLYVPILFLSAPYRSVGSTYARLSMILQNRVNCRTVVIMRTVLPLAAPYLALLVRVQLKSAFARCKIQNSVPLHSPPHPHIPTSSPSATPHPHSLSACLSACIVLSNK